MKRVKLFFAAMFFTLTVDAQECPQNFLGPDIADIVCGNELVNLENYFSNLNTYQQVLWNPSTIDPTAVPAGKYKLTAVRTDGCFDIVDITIENFLKPVFLEDKQLKICSGKKANLNEVYPLTGYSFFWDIANPTAVGPGTYTITVIDQDFCQYNAQVIVTELPSVSPALPNITVYNSGFTTNNFRTISADSEGNMWAGTTSGGLYMYNGNAWVKTRTGDNKTYRELAFVNTFSDGPKIWAASTGDNTVNATAGGMYYLQGENFRQKQFSNMKFKTLCFGPIPVFTVADSSGGMVSRFVTGVTTGKNNKIYAVTSQCTDIDTTCGNYLVVPPVLPLEIPVIREGGLYEYDPVSETSLRFRKINNVLLPSEDIKITAVGSRDEEIWVGLQQSCINGNCQPPYIAKYYPSVDAPAGFVNRTNSPLPFQNNPIIRAIFTDSRGRTYVGLSAGQGIGVYDATGNWHMITSQNSKLPVGAAVNFNAIAETEDGRILIGTTAGLLIYDGAGDFTLCTSYGFYNSQNGLPSNNITDVTYNKITKQIWLATDAGICAVGDPAKVIRGQVFNVYSGDSKKVMSELKGVPVYRASVKLFTTGGQLIESGFTDHGGYFEITSGVQGVKYDLEVSYLTHDNKAYNYQYKNINYDEIIGMVPIPDSLIKEIKKFIPELKKECPDISLPLLLPSFSICLNTFDTEHFETAFAAYGGNISTDHLKRVYNLAAYYFILQNVKLAMKNTGKLSLESGVSMLDFVEALFKVGDVNVKWKMFNSTSTAAAAAAAKTLSETITIMSELILAPIRVIKAALLADGNTEMYNYFKKGEDVIKGLSEIISKIAIDRSVWKGTATALEGMAIDVFKKILATGFSKLILTGFVQGYQSAIIQSGNKARSAVSDVDYAALYDSLILNNAGTAIPFLLDSERNTALATMEIIRTIAKVADLVSKYAKIAEFAAVTPQMKVFVKVVEEGAKVVQPFLHLTSGIVGLKGIENTKIVLNKSFSRSKLRPSIEPNNNIIKGVQVNFQPDPELDAKRIQFNQALQDLRQSVAVNDSVAYLNKLDNFINKDSLYRSALKRSSESLFSYGVEAINNIPSFYDRYIYFTESNYSKRLQYELALYNGLFAYQIGNYNQADVPELIPILDSLTLLNDSAYLALIDIKNTINNHSISSPAYMLVDKVEYNYLRQPSQQGTVSIIFRNAGAATAMNFKAKILPDSLLKITSSESILVPQVLPGATVNVNYTFITPASDTTVPFEIVTSADNGLFDDITGVISAFRNNGKCFTVNHGNWNDTKVWSNEVVPQAFTEVNIFHNVQVNTNAECKSVNLQNTGKVTVSAGSNLYIKANQ
jgi:hypothetical protein